MDVPAVFDAAGPGGSLLDGGSTFEGAGFQWATLGHLVDRGVLAWRFRVEGDEMYFGLITGAAPVPGGWRDENARGYEICTASIGWVNVLGATQYAYDGRPNYRMTPRDSEVECLLDMDARTMSFSVNGSTPPCVAFTEIVPPVRPIRPLWPPRGHSEPTRHGSARRRWRRRCGSSGARRNGRGEPGGRKRRGALGAPTTQRRGRNLVQWRLYSRRRRWRRRQAAGAWQLRRTIHRRAGIGCGSIM